jgi:hypothetical protein
MEMVWLIGAALGALLLVARDAQRTQALHRLRPRPVPVAPAPVLAVPDADEGSDGN